jgi:hypothetical protein
MSVGGAAANKGLLFQQRVGATFLLLELLGKPLSIALGEAFPFRPISFRFEGNNSVDDIEIKTEKATLFANIKTNLRLSFSSESPFHSVLKQFADQHAAGEKGEYLLIADEKTSSRLRELGILFDRLRLVDLPSVQDTLLDEDDKILYMIFLKHAGELLKTSKEDELLEFIKRIRIVIFSFDFNATFVDAIKILAVSDGYLSVDQLWEKLTIDCFKFSKARRIIDSRYLRQRYERFKSEDKKVDADLFSDLNLNAVQLNWSKEVVVVEVDPKDEMPFLNERDKSKRNIAIIELKRFDTDGARRCKFWDNKIEFLGGQRLGLLGRFSSFTGLERILSSGKIDFEDAEITIIRANIDWRSEESSEYAIAQGATAALAFDDRRPKDCCLECGKPLFATEVEIVEIDEIGRKYQCGLIHLDCLSPTDRVVGGVRAAAAEKYKFLKRFDINRWIRLSKRGPAAYGLIDITSQRAVITWNWTDVLRAKGDFCLKMIGKNEDGQRDEQYVKERGIINTGTEARVRRSREKMLKIISAAKERNDPFVFESSGVFGQRSQILSMDKDVGDLYVVEDFEIEKYSREKVDAFSAKAQWYTPICIVRSAEGKIFQHGGAVLLIRNPFVFDRVVRQLGLVEPPSRVEGLWLDIIESDREFDALVSSCFQLNLEIVIDPQFDHEGNPTRFTEVVPFPLSGDDERELIDVEENTDRE